MKDFKTLKEVCELLNVTRRIVQGYEKKGLVHTDYKDKYGHLLYDEETVKRIALIRFYQKMGFELKEIVNFIELPDKDIKNILIDKLNDLKIEHENNHKRLILIEELISNFHEDNIDKYLEVII